MKNSVVFAYTVKLVLSLPPLFFTLSFKGKKEKGSLVAQPRKEAAAL